MNFLFRKYFLKFSLVILDLSNTVVDLTDEPTQSSQSEATKTSQRWEEKEILMLLSCYEKFLPRFRKKRGPEKRIWGEVSFL